MNIFAYDEYKSVADINTNILNGHLFLYVYYLKSYSII